MAKHLRLDMNNGLNEHPIDTMKRLGIHYQDAQAQTIADQWWFWYCKDVPDPLPEYLSILDANYFEHYGRH